MQKFNLERALAGDPVVTRDGREVKQLTEFKDLYTSFCLYGIVEGFIESWTTDGSLMPGEEKGKDLFMKSVVMERWVNIYKTTDGSYFIGHNTYESEEDAIAAAIDGGGVGFIKTIKITDKV